MKNDRSTKHTIGIFFLFQMAIETKWVALRMAIGASHLYYARI